MSQPSPRYAFADAAVRTHSTNVSHTKSATRTSRQALQHPSSTRPPQSRQDEPDSKSQHTTPDNNQDDTGSWWMEAVDPHSGQHYYYHAVTKETSWQVPPSPSSVASSSCSLSSSVVAAAGVGPTTHARLPPSLLVPYSSAPPQHSHPQWDETTSLDSSSSVFDGVATSSQASATAGGAGPSNQKRWLPSGWGAKHHPKNLNNNANNNNNHNSMPNPAGRRYLLRDNQQEQDGDDDDDISSGLDFNMELPYSTTRLQSVSPHPREDASVPRRTPTPSKAAAKDQQPKSKSKASTRPPPRRTQSHVLAAALLHQQQPQEQSRGGPRRPPLHSLLSVDGSTSVSSMTETTQGDTTTQDFLLGDATAMTTQNVLSSLPFCGVAPPPPPPPPPPKSNNKSRRKRTTNKNHTTSRSPPTPTTSVTSKNQTSSTQPATTNFVEQNSDLLFWNKDDVESSIMIYQDDEDSNDTRSRNDRDYYYHHQGETGSVEQLQDEPDEHDHPDYDDDDEASSALTASWPGRKATKQNKRKQKKYYHKRGKHNSSKHDQNRTAESSSTPHNATSPYFFSFLSPSFSLFGWGNPTTTTTMASSTTSNSSTMSRTSKRGQGIRLRSLSPTDSRNDTPPTTAALVSSPQALLRQHERPIAVDLADPVTVPEDYYGINESVWTTSTTLPSSTTNGASGKAWWRRPCWSNSTRTLSERLGWAGWSGNYQDNNNDYYQQEHALSRQRQARFWLLGFLVVALCTTLIVLSIVFFANPNGNDPDNLQSVTDGGLGTEWEELAEDFSVIQLSVANVTAETPLDCTVALEGSDLALLVMAENQNASTPFSLVVRTCPANRLCLLVRTKGQVLSTTNGSSFSSSSWIPLARSYHGHAWEAYTSPSRVPLNCNPQTCTIALTDPTIDNNKDSLTTTVPIGGGATRQRRSLSAIHPDESWYFAVTLRKLPWEDNPLQRRRDEYARFLEQGTFGTTRADLRDLLERHEIKSDGLAGESASLTESDIQLQVMAEWIGEQMTTVPPTLHREFYRRHATARFASSSPTGTVTHPCQAGTTYRKFALVEPHTLKTLELSTSSDGQYRLLSIDGTVLTVLPTTLPIRFHTSPNNAQSLIFRDGSYEICQAPEAFLNGRVWLIHPQDDSCKRPVQFGSFSGNPPIQLMDMVQDSENPVVPSIQVVLSGNATQPLDVDYYTSKDSEKSVQRLLTTNPLTDEICSQFEYSNGGPVPIVLGVEQSSGEYWIHDPRFVLQENSLSNPLPDGGGTVVEQTYSENLNYQARCANVARTWQNEDSCYLSDDSQVCGSSNHRDQQSFELNLNATTLEVLYNVTVDSKTPRYIYAVDGLRIQDDTEVPPPCQPMARSRWMQVSGSNEQICQTLGSQTNEVLGRLIASHSDGTDLIRDIFLPAHANFGRCNSTDLTAKDFEVWVSDTCWHNVHPNHGQVYDFTEWLDLHPGGAGKISEFAQSGKVWLTFPSHHDMQQWQDNHDNVLFDMGRFGETIDFYNDLANQPLQRLPSVRQYFSSSSLSSRGQTGAGVVVCGSPGEVANDLQLGGERLRGSFGIATEWNNTGGNHKKDKETIWLTTALRAPDQLRQRMAWALSQILIVNFDANQSTRTEAFVHYYDIFVRHAFGNYRDVLKEVSYSVLMARMLTYLGSKSLGYNWRRNVGVVEHPDENFAREVMQLFTIGLHELNSDGSLTLDANGHPIRAYTNDDIMEYSRVWTGFERQEARGNKDDAADNRVDPMKIRVSTRDIFPKMGLNQKYIGDGYPLCADLPRQHFLKQGAKYILLGSSPFPELQPENQWGKLANLFVADPEGELNSILCQKEDTDPEDSSCTYPGTVILQDNIDCSGEECQVDMLRVVQIEGGIFYEYVPPPCVYHAFVQNPRKIKQRNRGKGLAFTRYMCADPRTAVASTACCFDGGRANASQVYWGERVLASTAEERCSDDGIPMCTSTEQLRISNCEGNSCTGPHHPFFWFAESTQCFIKAKFDTFNAGKIAIVHSVPDEDSSQEREMGQEEEDNKTFFRVAFQSGKEEVTDLINRCDDIPDCNVAEDGYCMCNVIVDNQQVFFSEPTKDEILSELVVGSFHPNILDGNYSITQLPNSVKVHSTQGQLESYSPETIFELTDEFGVEHLRKNVRSVVRIVGTNISFRNPVHFISLSEPTLRDAQYETDAAIDHYLYHKNTAPFLATRLAQRFGISNPSPRYVQVIAEAFRTGAYTYDRGNFDVSFGSGQHGDLAATVAAIFLDREARSAVLGTDPAYGSLKEPLLKVLAVMRNLKFQSTPEFPFLRFKRDLQAAIGQIVYESPSIFSFFLPEYQPSGVVANAGLVSPEAQIHSTPTILGTMNGLLAMMKYGLDRCFGGFGETSNWSQYSDCRWRMAGQFVNMSGYPGFSPTEGSTTAQIVDELATIMTSGRLNGELRRMIGEAVDTAENPQAAAMQSQQLIVGSSEFHSNGIVSKTGKARRHKKEVVPTERTYKALVVLMLSGGYDSYNLVVPHTCNQTNPMGLTVLEQYVAERGTIGLKESERQLTIDVDRQPCSKFAIHKKLALLQELYNQGDLSMFFNTGLINMAPTKTNFEAMTVSQLFAHNAMRKEAQTVDPYQEVLGTGILGRLAHALNNETYGFQAQSISINNLYPAVNGETSDSESPLVMSERGPTAFNAKPRTEQFDPKTYFDRLNGLNHATSSLFGEFWSDSFQRAMAENAFLEDSLRDIQLKKSCGSAKLNMVVRMMETRKDRGVDRDLFYVSTGNWDHHSDVKSRLSTGFQELNEALACYVENLKDKGLWDKTTLLVVSEFGRTLTPNTNSGSDHGWAGHSFAMGGALNGGKALGQYPLDLTADSPLNVGRGRLIPTLSWESIYMPICEWLGVSRNDCSEYVLPNSERTGTEMLRQAQVFRN